MLVRIGVATLLTLAPAISQGTGKLDADLGAERAEPDARFPIFVSMADQLFEKAGDYEAFCSQHATTARSKLRTLIPIDLKARAESSWLAIRDLAGELENSGELEDVTRFWIVNGFAASATAPACKRLAAHDAVRFVYRQRQPGSQHRTTARRPAWLEAREQDLTAALEYSTAAEPEFAADGLHVPWNLERVRVPGAWQQGAVGQGVVVALCDSGLLNTPALFQALWRNADEIPENGIDDDDNGYVDDVFGWDFSGDTRFAVGDGPHSHGSMCGGIVAGRPYGQPLTVTGVAPRARLMVLRGTGRLKAYEYAIRNGADVFSMSYMWTGRPLGNYRGVFRAAHEHMAACGVVAVGGAGNFRKTAPAGQQITLPKDIPCVIAAAGIMKNGEQAPFSSEGPCTWEDVLFYSDYPAERPLQKPDVTGVCAQFPVWHHTTLRGRKLQVEWVDDGGIGLVIGPRGNSFAGPHAAGVVALMLSVAPELTPWRIKQLLEASCRDLGPDGWDKAYGAGLLQADEAVRRAKAR